MKRLCIVAVAAVAAILVAASALLPSSSKPAAAAGPAVLSIGAPTASGGNIHVPVDIGGSGIDAYAGVTAVLLWDTSVFTFSSFDETGTVLPAHFCANGAATSSTGPHNGVSNGWNVGCATLSGTSTNTGLMGNFVLAPVTPGVGCSALHFLTLNPPDSDANGSASQAAGGADQLNTYGTIDVTGVDTTGAACTPPPPATATPTDTPVPPAPTTTPTATGTPKTLRTVTPTLTPTGTPTTAPAPTQPAGQTPAAPSTPGTGTSGGPSGGAGGAGTGTIRLPDTGHGPAAARTSNALWLAFGLAACGLGLLVGGRAWRRRGEQATRWS